MHYPKDKVVVAGHLCLDIIPTFPDRKEGMESLMIPGKLINIGAAKLSTGGAVSNTGLALYRLGLSTRLMGKVSQDSFGSTILELLGAHSPQLIEDMIVTNHDHTSYSVVISPPGFDRIFFHSNGTNDTFQTSDINEERLSDCQLFHFGYPPLMKKMYEEEGKELFELMSKVKRLGITTSLDMARPDPDSEAGLVDWRRILERVLPLVDIFMPSYDEILYMLNRPLYDRVVANKPQSFSSDIVILEHLSEQLLEMGAAIVAIKLGEHGLYVRTTKNLKRIRSMGKAAPNEVERWLSREVLKPCFDVEVIGTTGAGDCTIAGFLAGLIKGLSFENVVKTAVAVGSFNVECADATSGIPSWEQVQQRMAEGWCRKSVHLPKPWYWEKGEEMWKGPNDTFLSVGHKEK